MVQSLSGLQRVVLIPAGELHGSITLRFVMGSSDTCGAVTWFNYSQVCNG